MHEKHKSMKSHYIYTQLFKHCICLQCGRPRFNPWVGKIPWRRVWQSTPVFLPGKSHGQRTLAGYSPWGRKESDTTERLHFLSSKMGSLLQSGLLLVLIRLWHPMQHRIENKAQQGLKKDFLTLAMASGLPGWR